MPVISHSTKKKEKKNIKKRQYASFLSIRRKGTKRLQCVMSLSRGLLSPYLSGTIPHPWKHITVVNVGKSEGR